MTASLNLLSHETGYWTPECFHAFDDDTTYIRERAYQVLDALNELPDSPSAPWDGYDGFVAHNISRTIFRYGYLLQKNGGIMFSGRSLNALGTVISVMGESYQVDAGVAVLTYPDTDALEKIMGESFEPFENVWVYTTHDQRHALLQKYRVALLFVVIAGADCDAAVAYFRSHVTPDVNIDVSTLSEIIDNGPADLYSPRENMLKKYHHDIMRKVMGPLGERALDVPDTATRFFGKSAMALYHSGALSWRDCRDNYAHLMETNGDDIFHILTSVCGDHTVDMSSEDVTAAVAREIEAQRELSPQPTTPVPCSSSLPESWENSINAVVSTCGSGNTNRVDSFVRFYLHAVPDSYRDVLTAEIDSIVSALVDTALSLEYYGDDTDHTLLSFTKSTDSATNWEVFGAPHPRPYHFPVTMMDAVCHHCGDDVGLWRSVVCAMMRHGVSRFSDVSVMNVILTDPVTAHDLAHQWIVDIASNH